MIDSLIIIFVISIRISFGNDDQMLIPDNYILILLMLQAFDMLISMNTGFYLKG